MKRKPPVVVVKLKGKLKDGDLRADPKPGSGRDAGPPAERPPIRPDAPIPAIDRARQALAGVGEVRQGMYFLRGDRVTLGEFLKAANAVIEARNARRKPKDRTPLIGTRHERWGV